VQLTAAGADRRTCHLTMDVQKHVDPKGDRVVVTMNGEFLPYKKW
jgi:cyanate lyase